MYYRSITPYHYGVSFVISHFAVDGCADLSAVDRSDASAYCQRAAGAGELVAVGAAVARDLAVNPLTVAKAWKQLEQQGVVSNVRGIGMRIEERAANSADNAEANAEHLHPTMTI